MRRGRVAGAALSALLALTVTLTAVPAGPAAASHNDHEDELWVTVAINAAGRDSLWVTDAAYSDTRSWSGVAADLAIALGQRVGTFLAFDGDDEGYVEFDDKLAQPVDGGGLRWAFDTAKLQEVAEEEGYGAILFDVCTPRVRQVVDAPVAPESRPWDSPGSNCREWDQPVDGPPLRVVVQLFPDRDRYPLAAGMALGTAAVTFVGLAIGSTLLSRGPLRRRGVASWLVAIGSLGGVAGVGWLVTTLVLWLGGPAADPMLLGGGGVGEQTARTLAPGLAFLLPALVPAAILLTVPRREKAPPAPLAPPPMWPPQPGAPWATGAQPPTPAPPGPPPSQAPGPGAAPPAAPPLAPVDRPTPPGDPGSASGWAPPG